MAELTIIFIEADVLYLLQLCSTVALYGTIFTGAHGRKESTQKDVANTFFHMGECQPVHTPKNGNRDVFFFLNQRVHVNVSHVLML